MTETQTMLVSIIMYKSLTIIAGTIMVYLGFRLFELGVYEKAGELKAAWGEKNLALKQAAPGIFFSFFGAAVIATTVIKGIDVETNDGSANAPLSALLGSSSGYDSLTNELRKSLQKAIGGNSLSADEKTSLSKWLATLERKTRIRAAIDKEIVNELSEAEEQLKKVIGLIDLETLDAGAIVAPQG